MILLRAAYTQRDSSSNAGGLLSRFFGDKPARQSKIGNTKVFTLRMSTADIVLIRNAAKTKNMDVSVWAAEAISTWFQSFHPFYEKREEDPEHWLSDYTSSYLTKFNELASVYAQKAGQGGQKAEIQRGS